MELPVVGRLLRSHDQFLIFSYKQDALIGQIEPKLPLGRGANPKNESHLAVSYFIYCLPFLCCFC